MELGLFYRFPVAPLAACLEEIAKLRIHPSSPAVGQRQPRRRQLAWFAVTAE